ncbi:PH domain-containing protein [Tenuibacillus multivorans]|uniref:YdbS-like PH domain-containing protein n=1 Tax=Tenuibacillus multivorans TaxID=237069 RepID=A0A1H0FL75_9BACI|nr:PH domain-containing protein [Tenuibacillus multivorans]GEL77707.1 UPF0699 transmembrane protein YdbS [Tenuibacillus multivorans]SDN95241.1 hypothetical protein SAMN05216498_0296 [Tenuibacillus multivorans]
MRQPPKQRIAMGAIKAWRLKALILLIIPVVITGIVMVLTFIFDFIPYLVSILLIVITVVDAIVSPFLIPKLRWRRWRYEILDEEIYVQHGVLVVSQTLIPMVRVQHVDTKQGPILKNYQLATLTITTAATTHEIPALPEKEAADLRDLISDLARVGQDDV